MLRVNMVATGDHIKDLCKQQEVSPEYLSRYLNIDLSTIYYWFQGKSMPRWNLAFNLAELLHTTVNGLFIVEDTEDEEEDAE